MRRTSRIVGLGASAGGVEAVREIIACLPADGPPVMVVQHLPASFVAGFAARLDRASAARVVVARDGANIVPGTVYVAPGGRHLRLVGRAGGWRCELDDGLPVNGFKPSVDVLFASMAEAAGDLAVAAILSGMGRDGAEGLAALRRAGAHTFAQSAATSPVNGMPRAAFEAGAVEHRAGPDKLAQLILGCCAADRGGRRA